MDLKEQDCVTVDHSRDINAITRAKGSKNMFDSLSKQAREMLNFNVRKFDGKVGSEAELWLKDIREWLRIEDQSLVDALDLLLTDAAALLWEATKTPKMTDEMAKEWFVETFTVRKTITNQIVELAQVHQENDERFQVFEIRVRTLVKSVFSSEMTEEQIVRDIISNRAKDDRVKEIFMSGKTTSFEDARDMAKIQEKIEMSNNNKYNIDAIRRESYAAAVSKGKYNRRQQEKVETTTPYKTEERRDISYEMDKPNNARFVPIMNEDRIENGRYRGRKDMSETERRIPTVSLKDIARRAFNDSKGRNTPQPTRLLPGQCFCCGEKGHRRLECPLKDKCLICGKEGHGFRNCYLLKNENKFQKRVACIFEESQQENYNEFVDNYDNYEEVLQKSMDKTKNKDDPIAFISSVGSTQ